jgi:hypothetical protein
MADSYLAISAIAANMTMNERVRACATQQAHLGNAPDIDDPIVWTAENRYLWASSPEWGEKWDYAVETHPPEPPTEENPNPPAYDPGADEAVITDADILATVQELGAGNGAGRDQEASS